MKYYNGLTLNNYNQLAHKRNLLEIILCNNNEIKINSYVIKNNNHAIVIDPNDFDEIVSAIDNCILDYILLTHEHFDHIMAVDKLRTKYNIQVIAQKFASENIQSSTKNMSKFSNMILDFMNIKIESTIAEFTVKPADIIFDEDFEINWQGHNFIFKHTPGHSEGSCCILVEDYLFCGDSLFETYETSLKGPGKSKKDYLDKTIPFLNSLPKQTLVFSGHDNSFRLKDKLNPKNIAIDNFAKRYKYTNCFVDYNNFIKLLDISVFFVRNNSTFIMKKELGFYKFYYFINDYNELKDLNSFFRDYKEPIILEVVSKKNIDTHKYSNINFSIYKTFTRYYTNNKKSKRYNSIKDATKDDIKEIKDLIDSTFDPLSDYIPNILELELFVENKEIYIIRIDNMLAGVSIYQKKSNDKYYFRLSCVHSHHRPGIIGYMLASNSPKDGANYSTWIDNTNSEAIKLNSHLGFMPDKLQNYIFIKNLEMK